MTVEEPGPELVEVLVVGAGMAGITTGVHLKAEGYDDFVIIDKGGDFGGTWWSNTYPGVACDISSQAYSFGYAPNREWSRVFAPGAEIHRYLVGIAEEHDLRRHARFGVRMLWARWDDRDDRWEVRTTAGVFRARFLTVAPGVLEDAKAPDVPGLDTFPGRVFHSSAWPDDYDPTGDRVALVGTGASGIQIVPEIADQVARLTLFQRTPAWVLPKPDWTHTPLTRWLIRHVPAAQRVMRFIQWIATEIFLGSVYMPRLSKAFSLLGRYNIRKAIKDPAMRRALTPDYILGCKRGLLSNTFYPALARDNVELTGALTRVRNSTVIAADGSERDVDTLILCTGFNAVNSPVFRLIQGRDELSIGERWNGAPMHYRSVAVAGCPNLFLAFGPNGTTGSAAISIEATGRYIGDAMRQIKERGIRTIEVREDAQLRWKAACNAYTSRAVHRVGGCRSYYLDSNGDNLLLYPTTMWGMWRQMSSFDIEAYQVTYHDNAASPRARGESHDQPVRATP